MDNDYFLPQKTTRLLYEVGYRNPSTYDDVMRWFYDKDIVIKIRNVQEGMAYYCSIYCTNFGYKYEINTMLHDKREDALDAAVLMAINLLNK